MNGSVDKFAYPRQARKLGSVQYDIDVSAIEWNYIIALTIIIEYMLASKYFHFHNVADLSCSRMGGTCRYNWTSCSRRETRLSVFCRGACHDNGVYHVQHWQLRLLNESNRNRKLNSLRFFLNFDCDRMFAFSKFWYLSFMN